MPISPRKMTCAPGAFLALFSTPVMAHSGDHARLAAGDAARHALTAPDHLLAIGLLAAIVAMPLTRLALARVRR